MQNNVYITYSSSGLGTPAIGSDFKSGLIFFGAPSLPYGFSGSNIQEILSVNQASSLGINYASSTSAATYTDVITYHIAEAFRANPTLDLWVMITTGTSSSSTYSEIVTLQNATNGELRQIGIYEQVAFNVNNLNSIQGQINTNIANNKPCEAVYQCNYSGMTLTSLTDLNTANAQNVTVCLGQDGGNVGAALYPVIGKSIGMVGLTLGAISSAIVSESIGFVQNFNMDLVEMDTLAFANGALYSAQDDNLITAIDNKNYTFLRKIVGTVGSYFNSDTTAIVSTSDYSNVHNNRTIHKAHRVLRSAMAPSISAPVYFNADGTMALYSIASFKGICDAALAQMVSASELSKYKTIINASQNVLSTKRLDITVELLPVGVANRIYINLGFVLSI